MNSFLIFLGYITLYKIPFYTQNIRNFEIRISETIFTRIEELSIQRQINMDYYKKISFSLLLDEDFIVVEPDGTISEKT